MRRSLFPLPLSLLNVSSVRIISFKKKSKKHSLNELINLQNDGLHGRDGRRSRGWKGTCIGRI